MLIGNKTLPSFFGEHGPIPVDPKGRIILPRKIRGALPQEESATCIIAAWLDGCLAVFDPVAWKEFIARIQNAASVSEANSRNLIRYFASKSEEVKIDSQGRISISRKLLATTEATDNVVVIGAGDHAEIWNPQRYEQHMASIDLGKVAELTDLF